MKIPFLPLLTAVLAARTTSPSVPGATAVLSGPPAPPTARPNWLSKLRYYFKQPQQSEQQILFESFDRYLQTAVVQYQFSDVQDAAAFKEAAATLVVDTWYLDAEYGVVCLATSQMVGFDRLLPAKLRDTKSVTDADVHRSVLRTFPLHSVELPASNFANSSEVQRYLSTFTTIDLGHSWEGRPISAVLPAAETSKSTLYVCGVHGREWASVSTCLTMLPDLASSDAVIPLANPDGYEYTLKSDRLWSKNLQPTSLSFCPGHDLARGLLGDYDPEATQCSESWCGSGNDSPLEVRAIHSFADQFSRVVYIQGTERSAQSKVYPLGEGSYRVSLPDYGSSFLMVAHYLDDAIACVKNAIASIEN